MKSKSNIGSYVLAATLVGTGSSYAYSHYLQSEAKQEYWSEVAVVNNLNEEREKTEDKIIGILAAYSNSKRLDEVIGACQTDYNACEEEAKRPDSCLGIEQGNECPDLDLVSTYEHEVRMDVVRCCRDILQQKNDCLSGMEDCYLLGSRK